MISPIYRFIDNLRSRQTRRSGSRNAALSGGATAQAERQSITPTAHNGAEGMRTLSGDTLALEDDIGRTSHADYGDSESAMGIARKVIDCTGSNASFGLSLMSEF